MERESFSGEAPESAAAIRSLLTTYLDEAGRHRLLTRAEEVRLARRIEAGDRHARDRLVLTNLRLVMVFAKRYRLPPGSSLTLMDLVQEGTLGLIRAAELFDWRQDTRFSTYASFWIRQSIARALALNGAIRVPAAVQRQIRAIALAEHELKGRLGREPTDEEVAAAVPIPRHELAAIRIRTVVLSLDHPAEEGGTLGDLVASPTDASADVERELTVRALRGHVSQLPQRLREIVILHYGLAGEPPISLAEIGRRLGLSRERVRQLEGRALVELLRRSGRHQRTRRMIDRLHAFDPLGWLVTLKAGLLGSAASTVTTGLIATATVTSFSGWHGPAAPTARPEVQRATLTPDAASRRETSRAPSPTMASQPSTPSNATARERAPLSERPQPSGRTPKPSTDQLPDTIPATPERSSQPSDPPSDDDAPSDLLPQQQVVGAQTEPANPQEVGSSSPEDAAPRQDARNGQGAPASHFATSGDNARGAGPPPHAGPPSDHGNGADPPSHAGPPPDHAQGAGPPPHTGPPMNNGARAEPPGMPASPRITPDRWMRQAEADRGLRPEQLTTASAKS
jgi:RNA polymerase primary sigma factor